MKSKSRSRILVLSLSLLLTYLFIKTTYVNEGIVSVTQSKIVSGKFQLQSVNLSTTLATNESLFGRLCYKPVEHSTFLKTHKTGSTVIRKLVSKWRNRLGFPSIDLAKEHPTPFVGGYPGRINFKFVKNNNNKTPKVINSHFRFDAESLQNNLPTDTRLFTILREPWKQFQSSFNYYKHRKASATAPCSYMPRLILQQGEIVHGANRFLEICSQRLNASIPFYFRMKNYQAFDLGLDPFMVDDTEISIEVEKLDTAFHLVMINEYFDESLILLKELLCLDLKDLVSKKLNVGKYNFEELQNSELFNTYQKLDIQLYEHFNRSFWKKVDQFGRERMQSELKSLQSLREQLLGNTEVGRHHIKRSTKVANALTNNDLKPLSLQERVREIRTKQGVAVSEELVEYMIENGGGCY